MLLKGEDGNQENEGFKNMVMSLTTGIIKKPQETRELPRRLFQEFLRR
jgi:hypothetical protein